MRLIDADALDKMLIDAQAVSKEKGGNFRCGVIGSVRENIRMMPTVETEWNKELWNLVCEIYPNEGEIVLIVTPAYTDKEGIEYTEGVQCGYYLFPHDPTWFSSDGVTYGNGGMLEVEPTHWMKMPKPPKKDGEQE